MAENTKKLVGKVALVTGGSRGLGAEIARALADEGADVAISYAVSEQKAQAVTRGIEIKGVRTAAFQADQGIPAQPEGLIQAVVSQFGGLDILVNNAAVSIPGLVGSPKTDMAAMDRQWAVNALGVIATIRAAAKVMRNGGRIISVGSGVATRVGTEGLADYAGSKAAVVGYSKGAARDLASRNITINVGAGWSHGYRHGCTLRVENGRHDVDVGDQALRSFGRDRRRSCFSGKSRSVLHYRRST